jgi:Holliday junction resolvasome RuvABC DNA-binding subunit
LVNLGFNKNLAEKMIQKILTAQPDAAVEDVIKQALKGL